MTPPSGPATVAASDSRNSRRDHRPELDIFLRRSAQLSPTKMRLRPSLATATPTPLRHFHSSRVTEAPSPSSSDPKRCVALYKPKLYEVLVADVAESLAFSLVDGKTRLEIDFPPLPSDMSSFKGSSDDYIEANIQLALTIRKLKEKRETRACIVFPDKREKCRATQLFKTHRFAPSRAGCLLFCSSVPSRRWRS